MCVGPISIVSSHVFQTKVGPHENMGSYLLASHPRLHLFYVHMLIASPPPTRYAYGLTHRIIYVIVYGQPYQKCLVNINYVDHVSRICIITLVIEVAIYYYICVMSRHLSVTLFSHVIIELIERNLLRSFAFFNTK